MGNLWDFPCFPSVTKVSSKSSHHFLEKLQGKAGLEVFLACSLGGSGRRAVSSNMASWEIPCQWKVWIGKSSINGGFSSTPSLITGGHGKIVEATKTSNSAKTPISLLYLTSGSAHHYPFPQEKKAEEWAPSCPQKWPSWCSSWSSWRCLHPRPQQNPPRSSGVRSTWAAPWSANPPALERYQSEWSGERKSQSIPKLLLYYIYIYMAGGFKPSEKY